MKVGDVVKFAVVKDEYPSDESIRFRVIAIHPGFKGEIVEVIDITDGDDNGRDEYPIADLIVA